LRIHRYPVLGPWTTVWMKWKDLNGVCRICWSKELEWWNFAGTSCIQRNIGLLFSEVEPSEVQIAYTITSFLPYGVVWSRSSTPLEKTLLGWLEMGKTFNFGQILGVGIHSSRLSIIWTRYERREQCHWYMRGLNFNFLIHNVTMVQYGKKIKVYWN